MGWDGMEPFHSIPLHPKTEQTLTGQMLPCKASPTAPPQAPSPTAPPQRTTGLCGTLDPRPSFTARNRREAFGDRTAAAAWPVSPLRPPATAISVHAAPTARRRSCPTTLPSTFGTRGRRHRGPRRRQRREWRPRDVKSGGGYVSLRSRPGGRGGGVGVGSSRNVIRSILASSSKILSSSIKINQWVANR
jgi:hypothetical protein